MLFIVLLAFLAVSCEGALRTSYGSDIDKAKEAHDLTAKLTREVERKLYNLRDEERIVGYLPAPSADGRRLASSTPSNFLGYALYDPAGNSGAATCSGTPYANYYTGEGQCVQVYNGNTAGTTSFITTASIAGSTVTTSQQYYTDATCSTKSSATPTVNTFNTGCSQFFTLYSTFSLGSQPTATNVYGTAGYQTSACTTMTQLILVGGCMNTGSTSLKFSCSGTQLTQTTYTDGMCTTGASTQSGTIPSTCAFNTTDHTTDNIALYSQSKCYSYSPASSSSSSCFASSESVQMEDGSSKALADVQLGDRILTASLAGDLTGYSSVIAVPHAGSTAHTTFARLFLESGKDIKMTEDHLVLAGASCSAPFALAQAGKLAAGACVQTATGKESITAVDREQSQGVASAITLNGELIVVNGIVASPFAVNHRIANAFYSIHRLAYALFPALLQSKLVQAVSERFGDLSIAFSA